MSYAPVDPESRAAQLRPLKEDELYDDEQQQQPGTAHAVRRLRLPVSRPVAAMLAAGMVLVGCGVALVAVRTTLPRSSPGQEASTWRRSQRFFAQKDEEVEDKQSSHEEEEQEEETEKKHSSDAKDKATKEVREKKDKKKDEKKDEKDESNDVEKEGSTEHKESSSHGSDRKEQEEGDSEDAEEKDEKKDSSDGSCAKLWAQCGGKGFDGRTCCEEGSVCQDKPLANLPSYRQCRKEGDEDDSEDDSTVSSAEESNADCAKLWDQCGGEGFSGPTCCEQGTACHQIENNGFPSFHQCRPSSTEDDETTSSASETKSNCSKLWDQCGGDHYDGPTCCQGDAQCEHKSIKKLASYRQCRPPPPPACEDAKEGSVCHSKVQWDINTGIWSHPHWYKGLTAQSPFKEFQEYEWMLNRKVSKCNKPCGPGTCFFVFRYEGCDAYNEWTCAEPDDSVAFNCCCNYFHNKTNTTKPENPSPALANAMKAVGSDTPSLFCTAMCMPDSYEVGLLRAQYSKGKLGLFGCNEWTVYSNKTLRLNPEHEKEALETHVIDGPLSGVMGGEFHTVLNTEVFLKFWNKVIGNKAALKADWVVKLDPDTVFIPLRLRALLRTDKGPLGEPEPEKGLFLNNCHVGMHGPIEVLSKNALATYKANHKKCEKGKPAEHGQEDWFLRDCFHEIGVLKVDAYNVLLEGTLACQERPSSIAPYRPPCFAPQVAFHPFKSIESYMHCINETANNPWQLPIDPMGEGPHASNERHG